MQFRRERRAVGEQVSAPNIKCYSSDGRYPGSWESRKTIKSRCTTNLTVFLGKGENQESSCLCSGEKQQTPEQKAELTQNVLWKVGGTFQGEAFPGGDSWGFKSRTRALYPVGRGRVQSLGQLECSVNRTWQLEVLNRRAWSVVCLEGL